MVLRDGASPSECHVIDDTPIFLTIVILPPSTCDCSVTNSFLTSSPLSYAQSHTHTSPQPHVVVSRSTLSALFTHRDLSLHSVRMVLLDEGANPCECHVIDDTHSFQTKLILHTSTCDCSVADSFLTSFLSALSTSTHTHLTPVVVSSSTQCPQEIQPGLCQDGAAG